MNNTGGACPICGDGYIIGGTHGKGICAMKISEKEAELEKAKQVLCDIYWQIGVGNSVEEATKDAMDKMKILARPYALHDCGITEEELFQK